MNNSTPNTPILDDDALAEIEKRIDSFPLSPLQARALCDTVRALRERLNEETQYAAELRHRLVIADGVYNEKGEYTRYAQTAINRATDQPQSQLEQVTKERDDARSALDDANAADIEITAASMRSACVEKVRAMGRQWYAEAKKRGAAFSDKGRLAEMIAKELESVSVQGQEK